MKQIINGKMYNTETATKIDDHSYGENSRDFYHYHEALYRKKTGEFFVCGEGGPLSKYGEYNGSNCRMAGSKIVPCTYNDAKSWVGAFSTVEKYIEVFGEPDE